MKVVCSCLRWVPVRQQSEPEFDYGTRARAQNGRNIADGEAVLVNPPSRRCKDVAKTKYNGRQEDLARRNANTGFEE